MGVGRRWPLAVGVGLLTLISLAGAGLISTVNPGGAVTDVLSHE
jgi:hypothetical protein